MNWKSLFSPGANLTPDEGKQFIAEHSPGEYQLLDVRQPKEYSKGHLPGAILIPVRELSERLSELDPMQPVLVYCHSGVRSKAAAQVLLAADYPQVFNMSGGIIAYAGEHQASGDESLGMEFFVSGEFDDVFRMSYAMEHGLEQLYLILEKDCEDPKLSTLLLRLATFEKGHKAKLEALFPAVKQAQDSSVTTLEGGLDSTQILDHFSSQMTDWRSIIQLAIMLETQAFDLYSRLAKKEKEGEKRDFFVHMCLEEQQHLEFLSREYDSLLN
jgi:rhodanese-related sulfurtransferase/rubrerythrin